MRVALMGDIHGNLLALEAVLQHASAQGAQAIWNVGDAVGYGPFPDEVVRRLRQEGALSIAGNYDLKVLQVPNKATQWSRSKAPEKWFAFRWAYDHLSEDSLAYLASLPQEIRLQVEGHRVLIVHASPDQSEQPLTTLTPLKRLKELVAAAEADVIICGHSHQAFARQVAGTWLINTGSVGRPNDGDPRACYALLELNPDRLEVAHVRVEYDVDRTVAISRAQGLPETFSQALLQGRSLDDLTPAATPAPLASTANQGERRQAVLALAECCEYDAAHTHQVTRLALRLFDELQSLHQLGPIERSWLEYSALLHDIGWCQGQQGHHKAALKIILSSPLLPFEQRERLIIGSIARYHRRALPDLKHAHFAALPPEERRAVKVLAGLLRVADGLDYSHEQQIEDLVCDVTSQAITIRYRSQQARAVDSERATAKGQLLEQVLGHRLVAVTWEGN